MHKPAVAALLLHLPPNLAAAAARDAVALRIEMDPAAVPEPGLLPVLGLLQGWCGTPRPPSFIQLTRRQLRSLAAAAAGEPIFVEGGKPVRWQHDRLVDEPEPAAAQAAPPAPQNPRARRPVALEPLLIDGSEHYLAVTLPSREDPRYRDVLELLKASGFVLEPSNRKWWLRDRHKTLSFLAAQGDRLRGPLEAQFTPNFSARTAHLSAAEITCEASAAGDGWDVALGLRAGTASEAEVREAVSAGRGYLEVDGKIMLIDPARIRRLGEAQRALAGGDATSAAGRRVGRIGAARAAEVEELLEALFPGFRPPDEWRARTGALRNLSRLEAAPIPADFDAILRTYQRLGAAWLWHLHRSGLGGILADEMGLGKTLQALALLCAVQAQGGGASLVVCPASLVENWRREAARFAPHLRVFVHRGDSRLDAAADLANWDLVVTSYGTLARDRELLAAIDFACVVGDEAQHVKNRRSLNAQALRSLRSRGRFLLTGTPVENSLDDLRSLFEFILPGYLERVPQGARREERAWFDERLKAKTAHYILRRTKAAVAPELPARIEQVVWCTLEAEQAALYKSFQEKSERELFDLEASGAGESRLRMAALTQLLRLRQICCDPRLVAAGAGPESLPFEGSAKLESFREILAEAADDGHRILVFSQFTSLLALLRKELDSQGIAHCYLDGSMSSVARQAEIDRFQSSPETAVFLLSLKAGGTGLNLTGADTVIHFDPWWNPAAEAQATDRAHRIGQTRVVTSYKLVCSETVEEKVLALQDEKRALLAGVFEASDAVAEKISLADLRALLRQA
jgi:superfamily II DNA or RNA helicase